MAENLKKNAPAGRGGTLKRIDNTGAEISRADRPACAAARSIRLGTADDIRLEMARVYRDMKSGRIETQDGTRLVYVLGELRKAYETTIIERRMQVLEQGIIDV